MEVWDKPKSVDIVGPFEEHYVVIDGYRVPYLTATPMNGGMLSVVVDHRSRIDMTVADAEHVLPWVADCIAVASGFTLRPQGEMEGQMFARRLFVRMHSIVTEERGDPGPDPEGES